MPEQSFSSDRQPDPSHTPLLDWIKRSNSVPLMQTLTPVEPSRPQRPSIMERINEYNNNIKNTDKFNARENYVQCLRQYLQKHPIAQETVFHYPFDNFYLSKNKKRGLDLHYLQPFPVGPGRTTDKINLTHTMDAFLASVGLPGSAEDKEIIDLYHSLVEYLDVYRQDPSEIALRRIQRYNRRLAHVLRYSYYDMVNECLFLCYPLQQNPQYQCYEAVLAKHSCPPAIKDALICFSALVKKDCSILNRLPFPLSPPQMILQIGTLFNSISCSESGACVLKRVFFPPPFFIRPVSLSASSPEHQVPSQAAQILSSLTGGDVTATEKLSLLFAQVLSLTGPGATVIYSHSNAKSLSNLLSQILSPWVVHLGENAISINSLVTQDKLTRLMGAQIEGRYLVFLQDHSVSQSNRSKTNDLLRGKNLCVSDPYVSKQKLRNLSHLLCITSDRQQAQSLQKQLNACWIDLTSVERQFTLTSPLDNATVEWFRCFFPLRGLQILSAGEDILPKSSPEPFDAVDDFLDNCTLQSRDCFCTTDQLYDAYYNYYHSRFQCPPPLTKIQFGKRVRTTYIAAREPDLGYRKARLGADKSSRYFYTGLQPLGLDEKSSIQAPDTIPPSYQEYLNSIHSLMPSLSGVYDELCALFGFKP